MSSESVDLVTRQRLLEAAGEVFAESGFERATVRDICKKANANVAAINYHFRDKEGLYRETLKYAHQCAAGENVHAIHQMVSGEISVPAEQRLEIFIRTFLLRAFHAGKGSWYGKLVAQELGKPTAMLDQLVQTEIRPRANFLEATIAELIGGDAPKDLVRRCARSVVSQCVFYHLCKPMVQRLHPEQGFEQADLEVLADHITRFSLHAIKGIAKDQAS
jgi:AcrR family transcriptional regulator